MKGPKTGHKTYGYASFGHTWIIKFTRHGNLEHLEDEFVVGFSN